MRFIAKGIGSYSFAMGVGWRSCVMWHCQHSSTGRWPTSFKEETASLCDDSVCSALPEFSRPLKRRADPLVRMGIVWPGLVHRNP